MYKLLILYNYVFIVNRLTINKNDIMDEIFGDMKLDKNAAKIKSNVSSLIFDF
jgi:hypothetical protein